MSSERTTYEVKKVTVKTERVYKGNKTIKELVLELMQKRNSEVFSG